MYKLLLVAAITGTASGFDRPDLHYKKPGRSRPESGSSSRLQQLQGQVAHAVPWRLDLCNCNKCRADAVVDAHFRQTCGVLQHMFVHMAEHAQTGGPLWVHAMWPWERMWGRLVKFVHQPKNPAASMMKTYHTLSAARAR